MGGKHKPSPAQRTKGNVKPSSSARAAELLEQSGAGSPAGFIGFGSFADGLGQVSRLAGAGTDADKGLGTSGSSAHSSVGPEAALELDKDFALTLKKLSKKDAVTKLKGMQEFTQLLSSKDLAIVIAVLPYWPKIFQKMSTDVDRRVREATCIALHELVKLARRSIAPHIKSLMGPWLIAQCDPHAPAASAAQEALCAAFTPEKRPEAIGFCRVEILVHIADYLFEQTPETLSDPKTTDPEEMLSKYNRILSQSLEALSLFITSLPRGQHLACVESYRKILSNGKFWKFSKHQMGQVRAAFFTCVSAFCQACKHSSDLESDAAATEAADGQTNLIQEHRQQICTAVLYSIDESEPIVLRALWKAVLQVVSNVTGWWEVANLRKAVLPRLWTTLKSGGHGCAVIIYPSVLPLVSKMPVEYRQLSDTGDGSTAAWFWEQLLDNTAAGLALDRVQMSRIECNAVVNCLMECIKFCIHSVTTVRETDSTSTTTHSASILEKVRSMIMTVFKSSLVDKSSALANSHFYPTLVSLLVSLVQKSHVTEHGSQLVDDIAQVLLAQTSECERRARGAVGKNPSEEGEKTVQDCLVELERIGTFVEVCATGASNAQARGTKRISRAVSFAGQDLAKVSSDTDRNVEERIENKSNERDGVKPHVNETCDKLAEESQKDKLVAPDAITDGNTAVDSDANENIKKSRVDIRSTEASMSGFLLSEPEGSLRRVVVQLCGRSWTASRTLQDVSSSESFLRLFTRLVSSCLAVSTTDQSMLKQISAAIAKENPDRGLPLSSDSSTCFQFLVYAISDLLAPLESSTGSSQFVKSRKLSEKSFITLKACLRKVFCHLEAVTERLELVKKLVAEPWCLKDLGEGLLVEFVEEWKVEERGRGILVEWLGGEEFGGYVVGLLQRWMDGREGCGEGVVGTDFRWSVLRVAFCLNDSGNDVLIGEKYVNEILSLIKCSLLSDSTIIESTKPREKKREPIDDGVKVVRLRMSCDLLLFLFSLSPDLSFLHHPSIVIILLHLFEEELAQNLSRSLLEKIGTTWRQGYRAIKCQNETCRGFLADAMARLKKTAMAAAVDDLENEFDRLAQLAADLVEGNDLKHKADDCKMIIGHLYEGFDWSTLTFWQPITLFCSGIVSDVVPNYTAASHSDLAQAMRPLCFLSRFLVKCGLVVEKIKPARGGTAGGRLVRDTKYALDLLPTLESAIKKTKERKKKEGRRSTKDCNDRVNDSVDLNVSEEGSRPADLDRDTKGQAISDPDESHDTQDDDGMGGSDDVADDDVADDDGADYSDDVLGVDDEDQGKPLLREIIQMSTVLDMAAVLSVSDCISRLQTVDSSTTPAQRKIFTTLAALLERDFTTTVQAYGSVEVMTCALDRSLAEGGLMATAFGAVLRRLPSGCLGTLPELLKVRGLWESGNVEGGTAGVQTLQVALLTIGQHQLEGVTEMTGALLATQLGLLMTCPSDRLTSIADGGIQYLALAGSALVASTDTLDRTLLNGYLKLFSDWRTSNDHVLLFNTTLDDNPDPCLSDWLTVSLNAQMALFMKRSVAVGYPSYATDHWDTILCSLVSWLETLKQSRRDDPLTSSDPLTFALGAAVFEMAAEVIWSLEVQLPMAPGTFPPSLAEEWAELFCGSVYETILPMFIRTAEAAVRLEDDEVGPEMQELLLRMCSVVSQCRKSHLLEIRLRPLLQGEAEQTVLQTALTCLTKFLSSHIRCIQVAAYRMLDKIMDEFSKLGEALVNEADDKKIEGAESSLSPPACLIEALDFCLASLAVVLEGRGFGEPITLPVGSPHRHFARGYLLSWSLLLQLFKHSANEVRPRYASWLNERGSVDQLMGVLFHLMPGNTAARGSSNSGVVSSKYKWCFTNFPRLDISVPDWLSSSIMEGSAPRPLSSSSSCQRAAPDNASSSRTAEISSSSAEASFSSSSEVRTTSSLSARPMSSASISLASSKSSMIPSSTSSSPQVDEVRWLACSVYLMTLETLPAVVRQWWTGQPKQVSVSVERFTATNVSPLVCSRELASVSAATFQMGGGMSVKSRQATSEVVATYTKEECSIELVISLPANMPLGVINVDSTARLGIDQKRWRNWMLQLMTFLTYQNGSVADGLALWKRNVDNCFEGLDDCMICFSVVHGSNYQLPRLQCKTCQKRFHSVCLYRWFSTSQNSACPLCRNLF